MGTDSICPINQRTFEESEAFAKSKGGILCKPSEILKLKLNEGHLSEHKSYAAARDQHNNPKWIEVSGNPGPGTKLVVDAKDAKWTNNYK